MSQNYRYINSKIVDQLLQASGDRKIIKELLVESEGLANLVALAVICTSKPYVASATDKKRLNINVDYVAMAIIEDSPLLVTSNTRGALTILEEFLLDFLRSPTSYGITKRTLGTLLPSGLNPLKYFGFHVVKLPESIKCPICARNMIHKVDVCIKCTKRILKYSENRTYPYTLPINYITFPHKEGKSKNSKFIVHTLDCEISEGTICISPIHESGTQLTFEFLEYLSNF